MWLASETGNVLLSRAVPRQVSSALESLTSVFEMGTGVSSPLLSPDSSIQFIPEISEQRTSSKLKFLLKTFWSSFRPISIGQLNALLHLHLRPINVVVSHGSYLKRRKSLLVGGFALRCFQRLSRPYVATQPCPWQNNWYTRGMSIPVLSY